MNTIVSQKGKSFRLDTLIITMFKNIEFILYIVWLMIIIYDFNKKNILKVVNLFKYKVFYE